MRGATHRRRTATAIAVVLVLLALGAPAASAGTGGHGTVGSGTNGRPPGHGAIRVTELPPVPGDPAPPPGAGGGMHGVGVDISERGQVLAHGQWPGFYGVLHSRALLHDRGRWVEASPPDVSADPMHYARATALTDRGDVAGVLLTGNYPGPYTTEPFAFIRGRQVAIDPGDDLWAPYPFDMNDRGQVLFPDRVWQDGTVTVAEPHEGRSLAFAAINDTGLAVGTLQGTDGLSAEAATWQVGGAVRPLGTLPGYTGSFADAVNDAGVVAGHSVTPEGGLRSWVWRDGRMTDLGTLGGTRTELPSRYPAGVRTPGLGLNSWGTVVGRSETAAGEYHAFVWHGGRLTDLGAAYEGESAAVDVNDWGQVVGWAQGPGGEAGRLVLWQNGRSVDLTELAGLGGEVRAVTGIALNNRGQVTATVAGDDPAESPRLFVWDVPPLWGHLPG